MEFVTYSSREELLSSLAELTAKQLETSLTSSKRASLCVPGGSTPGPMFDQLCEMELDWKNIDVLLNDERWVPETSERSNTTLLKQRLIVKKAAQARLVPLYCDEPTPEEGLPALIDGIEKILPLSVLILGMGADMHTASLFPGADQLELGLSEDAPNLLAMRAPGAAEPRITLSAKALKTAQHTHVLITGQEKRDVLEAAIGQNEQDAPITAFLPHATVHWAQ